MPDIGAPSPRTWYPEMNITAESLRDDISNLAALLTQRPSLIAAVISSAPSFTSGVIGGISLDTEYYDNWNGHVIGNALYSAQLPGMYLAETVAFFNSTNTTTAFGTGIELINNNPAPGTSTRFCFGNYLVGNGVQTPGPASADLCQMQAQTVSTNVDTVAAVGIQSTGGSVSLNAPG